MRPLVALALLVGLAPAAPVPKALKAKKDDKDLMVGLWIAADPNTHSFRYNDDGTMKVWNGNQATGEASGVPYRWSLDATASPKRMTWYGPNPADRPQFECVYELDGDDLKITYNSAPTAPTAVGTGSTHRMTRHAPLK